MEMEVSLAAGMRVKWRSWVVESTRAMLKSGRFYCWLVRLCGMSVCMGLDRVLIFDLGGFIDESGVSNIPMPISFAFSWAASEAILAASRERVGRLFVADMVVVLRYMCWGSKAISGDDVWMRLGNGRGFKWLEMMCLLEER
jgi:hypothetical protein